MVKQLHAHCLHSINNKPRPQIPVTAKTAPSLTLQVRIVEMEQPRRFKGQKQHCIETGCFIRWYGKIIYSATDISRSEETFRRMCWIWLTMNSVLRELLFSSQTAKMWLYYRSSHSPHMNCPSTSKSYGNCRWQQPSRN